MQHKDYSYATLGNLPEIERVYQLYLQDPQSVEPSWRYFFEGMGFAESSKPQSSKPHADLRLFQLIEAYRQWGHLKVRCNPISLTAPQDPAVLKPAHWGFKQEELSSSVFSFGLVKQERCSLKELIGALEKIYCGSIGIEYMHIQNEKLRHWIQTRLESSSGFVFSNQEKKQLLHHLNQSELFETFLHTKYAGQKRFSLEGLETLIPLLSMLIERGSSLNVQEAVIGMSHRGRLNVLANILGKSYSQIFHEFEDHYAPNQEEGTGDVKYHKGFVGSLTTGSGKEVCVVLAANPSHLESVDPITEGIARAKQEEKTKQAVLPILIHGDAAVAGQGVVYETLQIAKLPGYETGGTVHIVANNQVGFTTSPQDSRSTLYCSDLAKAFNAPIFHVNAEDPLSCTYVAKLCAEIRQEFGCDVFIDLNGYRKYGHNEGDEPTFTQPLEYALIRGKQSIYTLFCKQLILEGVLTEVEAQTLQREFKETLQKALQEIPPPSSSVQEERIQPPVPHIATTVSAQRLKDLASTFCRVPEGFKIHPKVHQLQQSRLNMLQDKIDWGMGEHLAFATLLDEKISIRLSGQDVGRGTFSHRHALIVDQVTGAHYFPLAHLNSLQGSFKAYNSPLSEYAVLGFDFGYSITNPSTVVIWEAQFGDFANTAQVPIDQYIASSEQKWGISTRLTLMLPHGYEGQGPEHSSARMERFLQLCAQDNMRVVNGSTPAQLFHVLRQQGHFSTRKPLVIFTPKALLRHPSCVSTLQDLTEGKFQEIIEDTTISNPTKLLLCSGKVYYDLIQEREKKQAFHTAIARIEQLYPFPEETFLQLLNRYKELKEISWVQEEPSNMGAWEFVRPQLNQLLGGKEALQYYGRERSASPAAGSYALHKKQLAALLETAFR